MRLTIQIPDEVIDKLGKEPAKFIQDRIDFFMKYDPRDAHILLKGKDIANISGTVGGRNLRTAEDVVKLFIDNFRIRVDGVAIDLDVEDANAIKERYSGFDFMPYNDFLADCVKEGLSLYLWGSTRGTVAYQ
jgi:hypothetical protein